MPGTYISPAETGFYYLQSRYYDPTIKRFINSDGLISTGQGLLGNNMFAYCGNNPLINIDQNGYCYFNSSGKWCHDMWEYTGNYEFKDEPIDVYDLLNEEMEKNLAEFQKYIDPYNFYENGVYFRSKVQSKGDWDLKYTWNLDPNSLYVYDGMILRYDDLGNINYGFVGKSYFTTELLLIMAGYQQIRDSQSSFSLWKSNFDDSHDQEMIKFGIELWSAKYGN